MLQVITGDRHNYGGGADKVGREDARAGGDSNR